MARYVLLLLRKGLRPPNNVHRTLEALRERDAAGNQKITMIRPWSKDGPWLADMEADVAHEINRSGFLRAYREMDSFKTAVAATGTEQPQEA